MVKPLSIPCGPSIIEKAFQSQLQFTFSHINDFFCPTLIFSAHYLPRDQLLSSSRSVTSPRYIVMVKVQFSHFTVKLVSHKCNLWFGRRWCNGYVHLTGRWEVESDVGNGREGCKRRGRRRRQGYEPPEVEECGSEPEMIPRSKSFSLTLWSLTCASTRCSQIVQLMEDNEDSDDGIIRFMTISLYVLLRMKWRVKFWLSLPSAVLLLSFWPGKAPS